MIRYAMPQEKTAILNLFNICFPGEEVFAEYFFKNHFSVNNTIVDETDGVIRGSAMALPNFIDGVGEVTYLYAVGTLPEFRGEGICRSILKFSHKEDMKNNRKASILIPAKKELFGFYERFGYKKAAFLEERGFILMPKNSDFAVRECSPRALNRLYEDTFKGRRFIKRGVEYFEGQIKLFKVFGGGCLGLYRGNGLLSYCFYSMENSELKLDEILGDYTEELASEVMRAVGASACMGRTCGRTKPFGMAYFYDKEFDFYMNLMFN